VSYALLSARKVREKFGGHLRQEKNLLRSKGEEGNEPWAHCRNPVRIKTLFQGKGACLRRRGVGQKIPRL